VPDIEKKRRRSARVYVRPDKLTPEELDQRLAVIARYFPADEDAAEPTPAHAEARARTRAMKAAPAVPDTGLPSVGGNVVDGADYNAMRGHSGPVEQGHPSCSTGDHQSGQGRNPGLAARHADLAQSNTRFSDVLARLRTAAGDNTYGDRSITYTAGEVGLSLFDAAAQSGRFDGMQQVNWAPSHPADHQSRQSPVPPNGPHGMQPLSRAPQSMKASEAREILRRHMFPGSGGSR
jgi:hypothetical protein